MTLPAETRAMADGIWTALGLPRLALESLEQTGDGELPSVFAVTDLAVASVGAAALALACLAGRTDRPSPVRIDRARVSWWFSQSIRPLGWPTPPTWDPLAGDYATADGWIRLHTNAAHHRDAALRALELDPQAPDLDRAALTRAVANWESDALEAAVLAQGGCAARMRSSADWAGHPQGKAVTSEPLLAILTEGLAPTPRWTLGPQQPLAGLKVLDLTRILAGPVATRFLAGHGAQVLRIDPPGWDEPLASIEMTLGKRRARIDLRTAQGVRLLESLLGEADVLVHGYRPDALDRLGLGAKRRRALNPGLVETCLDAYGWTGPWQTRRGFDSLVQMSTGIAQAGMELTGRPGPTPLPVQALDHATGYLLAAAVLRGLAQRLETGAGSQTRASLARTAAFLMQHSPPRLRNAPPLREETDRDLLPGIEQTAWGPARRLAAPYEIEGLGAARWSIPAGELGVDEPLWL